MVVSEGSVALRDRDFPLLIEKLWSSHHESGSESTLLAY